MSLGLSPHLLHLFCPAYNMSLGLALFSSVLTSPCPLAAGAAVVGQSRRQTEISGLIPRQVPKSLLTHTFTNRGVCEGCRGECPGSTRQHICLKELSHQEEGCEMNNIYSILFGSHVLHCRLSRHRYWPDQCFIFIFLPLKFPLLLKEKVLQSKNQPTAFTQKEQYSFLFQQTQADLGVHFFGQQ